MIRHRNKPTPFIAAALCASTLAGCVVAPARPYAYAPSGAVIVADVAPPAPYAEVVPVAPFVDAVWIGGYWGWHGGRHVWVPGRYEHSRPGHAWQAHRWAQHDGRWHLEGGGWVRR
ncbi:MAG: hypothetical protein M3Z16_12270 [Pseudomonadota bacterium]|nr:hypothetical protein [Pseudomonadota bacterium]